MPAGPRPIVPPWVSDAAIALGVAVTGLNSGLNVGQNARQTAVASVSLTAMGLILFPRRRLPGTVAGVMAVLVATLAIMHTALESAFPAVLVASYSAAVYGRTLLTRILLAAAIAAVLGVGIADGFGANTWLSGHYPVRQVLAAAGAWFVGLMVRKQLQARTEHIAMLAERADLLAAKQAESEHRATLAERLRIAREMHDIVAHHISVVVIQSQAAQRVADADPARAKTAMADVERTSRTALEEMRRLLGLLRSGEPARLEAGTAGQKAESVPLPDGAYVPPSGLADIDILAERLRLAGLDITIVRQGEAAGVPDDVGLTVYRIVQESLTNVLKHAGPAIVTVELEFADRIRVTVTDDGRGASAALTAIPGAGRGLAGMRERVAALGGTFSAGPKPGGGYRVHATIPAGG
jgi:signal transduction histidine kinase